MLTRMGKSTNGNGPRCENGVTIKIEESNSVEQDIVVCGTNLSGLPQSVQFLVLSSGIFFFYLIYGYIQVCMQMLMYVKETSNLYNIYGMCNL